MDVLHVRPEGEGMTVEVLLMKVPEAAAVLGVNGARAPRAHRLGRTLVRQG
jgi:hypothetical protein